MQPGFIRVLRSKGLAVAVHLAFWGLLFLVVTQLGGKAPQYKEAESYSLPRLSPAPVNRLKDLFPSPEPLRGATATNLPSPFYTTAFLPAPKEVVTPPKPPPTTKKITVVYQGFYTVADGTPNAIIKTPQGFLKIPLGKEVVTNYFASALNYKSLTLTNSEGQTNLLLLNKATELEIPIK